MTWSELKRRVLAALAAAAGAAFVLWLVLVIAREIGKVAA